MTPDPASPESRDPQSRADPPAPASGAGEGYEAALRTAAVFSALGRRVVEVAGRRTKRVMNGLVSNTLEGLDEGRCRYAFVLDPKGRTVADVRLLPHPGFAAAPSGGAVREALWLDVPEGGLEPLLAHLGKYVPPIFADARPLEVEALTVVGPLAAEAVASALEGLGIASSSDPAKLEPLRAAGLAGPAAGPAAGAEGTGGLLARREEREIGGFDLYPPSGASPGDVRAALLEAARSVGGTAGERADWETLRVERGVPALGRELTGDRLVQEAGQEERAIDYGKGCYTGQEVVARIHYRGRVNRHLRGLRSAEAALLEGPELFRGDRAVATVSSRVDSPRFGPIALGYVRREVGPGERLSARPGSDPAVEVVELPFTLR